jgi:hypothetical protein
MGQHLHGIEYNILLKSFLCLFDKGSGRAGRWFYSRQYLSGHYIQYPRTIVRNRVQLQLEVDHHLHLNLSRVTITS